VAMKRRRDVAGDFQVIPQCGKERDRDKGGCKEGKPGR
jgi:hypothetical protein